MTPRVIGAACALLAALAFAIALVGGAAPKLLPGWWDGHPRIEGRVFERKDLHIGLVEAHGCNRGEEIRCQPLQIKTLRTSIGYLELIALALLAATAVALMRSLWAVGDLRKNLGKAVLVETAVAVVGGALILALGPAINATQRFEVPVGFGMLALWGGVAFATVSGFIAMRLEPEPLRLKSTQPRHLTAQPKPSFDPPRPVSERDREQDPMVSTEAPTLPRVSGPPITVPPPIPPARKGTPVAGAAVHSAAPTATSANPIPQVGPKEAAVSATADLAPATGPTAAPNGSTGTPATTAGAGGADPAQPFGRGAVPPPLSSIPFWSGAKPPVSATAPTVIAPAPPVLPQPPKLPNPQDLGAPHYPTIIHAMPPPPTAAVQPETPHPPPESQAAAAIHGGSEIQSESSAPQVVVSATAVAGELAAPADAPQRARPATIQPTAPPVDPTSPPDAPQRARPATIQPTAPPVDLTSPPDDPQRARPATIQPTAPPVDVPISTAPPSLPPPKKAVGATTGPAPSCPQCESAMDWVDEHLRFYCAGCRMYF